MSTPRFSVVIPSLHSPTLPGTLRALEAQTLPGDNYEVVVVGMDDRNSIQTARSVRFDQTDRSLSPAAARNRGVAQAAGEVVAFTDADCEPAPNWLEVFDQRFADAGVNVVGGGVEFTDNNYWMLADNISMFHEYLASLPAGQRLQLPSLNLAIRRSVFDCVGGFDERYPGAAGEDSDLTTRLRQQGHVLHFEPRAIVTHTPPRDRLFDLARHGFYQGKYSIKVDPRYAAELGLPAWFRSRLGVVLCAPVLAMAATMRALACNRRLLPYWYTFPAILVSKIAWCIGAANHP